MISGSSWQCTTWASSGGTGDSAGRLVGGATLTGLGIALATLLGFDGNALSLDYTGVVTLVIGGAWTCGVAARLA